MKYNEQQTQIIDNLCEQVYQRKFRDAEEALLGFIESIMKNTDSQQTETIQMLHSIYHHFTSLYVEYLEDRDISIENELKELMSEEHDNILIANSSDMADMDDLLYEVLTYLTDREVDSEQEVQKHMQFYRQYIN